MRSRDVRQVDAPHDAYSPTFRAASRGVEVLEVEHDHVAAVATVSGKVATGGCVGLRRGHDLQEAVAQREHDVDKSKRRHPGIAEGLAQPERGPQLRGHRLELLCDEHSLTQTYARWILGHV